MMQHKYILIFLIVSSLFAVEVDRLAILGAMGGREPDFYSSVYQKLNRQINQLRLYQIIPDDQMIASFKKLGVSLDNIHMPQNHKEWDIFTEYWDYMLFLSIPWETQYEFVINAQFIRTSDGNVLQSLAVPGQRSNVEDAVNFLTQRIFPDRKGLVEEIRGLCQNAIQKKDWDRVIAYCNWTIRLDSQNMLAFYNRAKAYEATMYFQEAEQNYRKALEFARSSENIIAIQNAMARVQPKLQMAQDDRKKLLQMADDILKPLQENRSKITLFPKILQEICQNKPDVAEAATLLVASKQLCDAIPKVIQALHTSHTKNVIPQDLVALIQEAEKYEKQRKTIEDFLAKQYLDFAPMYVKKAQEAQSEARWEMAMECLDKALLCQPNEPEIYYLKAEVMLAARDFTKAIFWLNTLMVLDATRPSAYVTRGKIYADINQLKKAQEDFQKAVELYPAYSEGYYNLAEIFAKQNEDDMAIENYNKTIELNPQYSEAYFGRGLMYDRQLQYLEALSDYKQAASLSNHFNNKITPLILKIEDYLLRDTQIYVDKAMLSIESGEIAQALDLLQKSLTFSPNNSEALFQRAWCYYLQGKYLQALEDYKRAFNMVLPKERRYYQRGLCHEKMGNLDLALQDFQATVQLSPEFHQAYYRRAKIMEAQKQFSQAIKNYEAAIGLCPTKATYCFDLAKLYAKLGKHKEARTYLLRARDQK